MSLRNDGLQADPLFVAATRPPMRFGVTTSGMVLAVMFVAETFLMTHNLLWLLSYIPIHGLLALILMPEPRYFDLASLWARTKGQNWIKGNFKEWKVSSYTAHRYNLANKKGRRSLPPLYSA